MNQTLKEIIFYLDQQLKKSNRTSFDAVEANEILEKAGLLKNSKDRPGKPLRDLLRKGLIPHAKQPCGKGSTWIIPLSNSTSIIKDSKSNYELNYKKQQSYIRKDNGVNEISYPSSDVVKIYQHFITETNYKSAASLDSIVPNKPGFYCIRIKQVEHLPKFFQIKLIERSHNILYVGIASQSLFKRMLNQELRAKGHGTFFRSIGAMLGYVPEKGSLLNKSNKRNYKFSTKVENDIIHWINNNLIVSWLQSNSDLDSIESELIIKLKPLINIAKNPYSLEELVLLRKKCVEIANGA